MYVYEISPAGSKNKATAWLAASNLRPYVTLCRLYQDQHVKPSLKPAISGM